MLRTPIMVPATGMGLNGKKISIVCDKKKSQLT